MSDKGKAAATPVDMSSGDEADPGYKAPAKATISELLAKDKGDPQMEKYKQSLLGAAAQGAHLSHLHAWLRLAHAGQAERLATQRMLVALSLCSSVCS